MALLDLNLFISLEHRLCVFCNKKLKDSEEIACADRGCFELYYQNLDKLSNETEKKKAFSHIQSKININILTQEKIKNRPNRSLMMKYDK